jgi:hypothetical protein
MSGTAADVICVEGEPGNYFATDFHVKFERDIFDTASKALFGPAIASSLDTKKDAPGDTEAQAVVVHADESVDEDIDENTITVFVNERRCLHVKATLSDNGMVLFYDSAVGSYQRNPSSATLRAMQLRHGQNTIRCRVEEAGCTAEFSLWVYDPLDKLVIMDVDGTVTKSDVRGYIESVFVGRYKYVHRGLPQFLNTLVESMHVNILYLTSRPIYHINQTKQLIENARKGDSRKGMGPEGLPAGPVFPNRETLCAAAYREFSGNTVEFKASSLVSIADVFQAAYAAVAKDTFEENGVLVASPTTAAMAYPFVLGIGNKVKDAIAYNHAGLKPHQILIIDTRSELVVWQDKCRDVMSIADSLDDADMGFEDESESEPGQSYDTFDENAMLRPTKSMPRERHTSGTWSVTGTILGGLRSMFAEGKGSFDLTSSGGREAGRLAGYMPEMKTARANRSASAESREQRRLLADAGNYPSKMSVTTMASSTETDVTTPKFSGTSASDGIPTHSSSRSHVTRSRGNSDATRSRCTSDSFSERGSDYRLEFPGVVSGSGAAGLHGYMDSPSLKRRFSGYEDPATLQYVEDILRTPMSTNDAYGVNQEALWTQPHS